jgi:hypothetical protein
MQRLRYQPNAIKANRRIPPMQHKATAHQTQRSLRHTPTGTHDDSP